MGVDLLEKLNDGLGIVYTAVWLLVTVAGAVALFQSRAPRVRAAAGTLTAACFGLFVIYGSYRLLEVLEVERSSDLLASVVLGSGALILKAIAAAALFYFPSLGRGERDG